jgi:predicted RNA-binding Zn ribbon-like protein
VHRRTKHRRLPRTSEPRPAPGDLAPVQAFVNTVVPERGDELASPEQLGPWLARHGLLGPGVEPTEDDWRHALIVRDALREMTLATTLGREPDAEAIARLERAVAGATSGLRFDAGGPAGFDSAKGSVDDALGTLLAAVAAARLAGHWALFKTCARDGCRRAFYDASQSRTGKWCTARCGDRVRSAAYRRAY